jgi:hypothetical protein
MFSLDELHIFRELEQALDDLAGLIQYYRVREALEDWPHEVVPGLAYAAERVDLALARVQAHRMDAATTYLREVQAQVQMLKESI